MLNELRRELEWLEANTRVGAGESGTIRAAWCNVRHLLERLQLEAAVNEADLRGLRERRQKEAIAAVASGLRTWTKFGVSLTEDMITERSRNIVAGLTSLDWYARGEVTP